MAKRNHKPAAQPKPQDDTQEMPVIVETVKAEPLKTVETVEVREPEASLPRSVVKDGEDCYIYNEDTGELRMVRARAGYAPAPMPFGFRLARNEEIPGK